MNNFDYKKYSLENLEKWIEDAINSSEASPQEIFDVIKNVVADNYYCYKNHTERCYELLTLLNGNSHINKYEERLNSLFDKDNKLTCDKDDKSPECQKTWNDFWEDSGSSKKSSQYTEEELNAMCEKAASDQEKEKCREYNLREAEYYDKRAQLDLGTNRTYDEMIADGYWMTDDGFWMPPGTEDKVVKWQLPVEIDGVSGEYYVQFPDDLMEASGIREDDLVEWIDRGDGSFELRKVNGSK